MKKIIFLFLSTLAILFVSCQGNSYSIEGKFSDNSFDTKVAYLQKIDSINSQKATVIDSATISDGKFSFKGTADEPMMGFVSVGKLENADNDTPIGTLILEPGNIKITFDKTNVTLGGTPKNDEFNNIHKVMNTLTDKISKITPQDANNPAIRAEVDTLQKQLQMSTFNFAKANISNKAGEFLFFRCYVLSSFMPSTHINPRVCIH